MIMLYVIYTLLLPLFLSVACSQSQKYVSTPSSICDDTGCNCSQIELSTIVTCDFKSRNYTIDANSMPKTLEKLYITGGARIIFEARSFSKLASLNYIVVRNVTNFSVKRESFVNLSTPNLELNIINIERVEIESKSFYLLKGPITYVISECWSLTIHSEAMPWIRNLTVRHVKFFELHENAFSRSDKKVNATPEYNTKILIQKVTMVHLPKNSFPSSATEVKLLECDIEIIQTEAFSALEIKDVTIMNSSFKIIQSEAFSQKSLIQNLQLTNVKIKTVRPGAFLSAVINFKIANSNMEMVEHEAFNISQIINIYFISNIFGHVKQKGITLRAWRNATIENNTLSKLDNEAINVPYQDEATIKEPSYFRIVGNILNEVEKHSIKLGIKSKTEIFIKENIFIKPCHCDWRSFLNDYVQAADFIIDSMYNESYCSINEFFAKCFNRPNGFMRAINFSEQVCTSYNTIVCQEEFFIDYTENPNLTKGVEILNENKANHERFLVSIIAAVAIIGIFVTVFLSICMWLRSNGKSRSSCLISSIGNRLLFLFPRFTLSRNINRVASANSITRVSIHEYAEVGPLKLLPNDPLEEYIYMCEDKATQTLPEELTQELLQTLRRKLDDPQNYTEARNMIEHLYDLIKVEECCNNNVLNEKFGEINFANSEGCENENENVYDIIKYNSSSSPSSKQRIRRFDKSFKMVAHKGTRAPSPDKLSPLKFKSSSCSNSSSLLKARRYAVPSVSEYMEPSDRHSCIYSELIYDQCGPQSSNSTFLHAKRPDLVLIGDYTEPLDYKVPVYSELDDVSNRPLPITPTIVNRDQSQRTQL